MVSPSLFGHWKQDLPASVVVFLVALPLCLGIALASGAPLISGLIAGVIGGIVVGFVSGSEVGVSGPAAGLAVIVLNAIHQLGSFEQFLTAVIIAGVIQVVLGLFRAGVIAYYFPSAVIKGMLAGIGLIIILKQIPHAFGYNQDYEGDLDFVQPDDHNTISELYYMLGAIAPGSLIIAAVGLAILIAWETRAVRSMKVLGSLPGPLIAVMLGIVLGKLFDGHPTLGLNSTFFVQLPEIDLTNVGASLPKPVLSGFMDIAVWGVAFTVAIVASIETLLCVEASDKMDPAKHVTPTDRELVAQGTGNILAGFLGGLPITQVIVRSSANIQAGNKTRMSAVYHGVLLLLCVLLLPGLLSSIPLASLAAVLLLVGYKLAKPDLFRNMAKAGYSQFIPFMITILGVVFTDLLTGVAMGMVVGFFFILRNNYKIPFHFNADDHVQGQPIRIRLSEDVSFLNKASILRTLSTLPAGSHVVIDASRCHNLDPDVREIIEDQKVRAQAKEILLEIVGLEQLNATVPSKEGMRDLNKMMKENN